MDKNKRDLMILIAIIFIGINYATYTYFISQKMKSTEAFKNNYIAQAEKLSEMEVKKETIKQRKKEIEKLKKDTASFSSKIPSKVNTPELIYDFYTACQKYKVIGDSVSFQLLDNSEADKTDKSEDESLSNANVYTLTISLKVTGHKIDMETFIKNLNTITKRKLNIKSIALATLDLEDKDEDKTDAKADENGIEDILNKTSLNETKPYTLQLLGSNLYADGIVRKDDNIDQLDKNNIYNSTNLDKLDEDKPIIPNFKDNTYLPNYISAEIVFYQYIEKNENNESIMSKNYEFYDSKKEGFDSIADMFK